MANPIARLLPEPIKAAVRPLYRRVVQGVETERDSGLGLKNAAGREYAFRKGTTDEIIIGNSDAYRLENLLPEVAISDDATIINIGAHVGVFAAMAAPSVPRGTVHAIEAALDTFNFMRVNLALNRLDNVVPHHLAIAGHDGECTLYHDTGHWGHSITKALSTVEEKVPCQTLETFMNRNDVARCQLLWLNCEGAEFPLLLGASRETLARVDVILTDCHIHLWTKNTVADLAAHLRAAGFEIARDGDESGYDRLLALRPERVRLRAQGAREKATV